MRPPDAKRPPRRAAESNASDGVTDTHTIHPAATAWPLLAPDELQELADSITEVGLLAPIVRTPDGAILDGRNRLAACELAGIEPTFVEHDGAPIAYVLAANRQRRHMSKGALAMAAVMTANTAGISYTKRELAEVTGVSDYLTGMAKIVAEHRPDLATNVINGSEALKDCYDIVRLNRGQRREQSNEHPATFSTAIMEAIVELLNPRPKRILDPFAGVGNIHTLADRFGCDSIGVEIEQEWADLHERTICLDSTTLTRAVIGSFDAVVTSPTYGNRLADKHVARDNSDRSTYKHRLGRVLSDNNTGRMYWGDGYRKLHIEAYRRVVDLLEPGGVFVLNIKDHVKGRRIEYVSDWHVAVLIALGLNPPDASIMIPTKGHQGVGSNTDKRVEVERVYRLTKPTEQHSAHARKQPARTPNGESPHSEATP